MSKMVQILDPATNKVTAIPAAELAPGMIEADVQGVGRVWIRGSDVKPTKKFLHPPFPENVRKQFRQIKSALDEVFPKTL